MRQPRWEPLDFTIPDTRPQAGWREEIDTFNPVTATKRQAGDQIGDSVTEVCSRRAPRPTPRRERTTVQAAPAGLARGRGRCWLAATLQRAGSSRLVGALGNDIPLRTTCRGRLNPWAWLRCAGRTDDGFRGARQFVIHVPQGAERPG
jgi:hypothetical protein